MQKISPVQPTTPFLFKSIFSLPLTLATFPGMSIHKRLTDQDCKIGEERPEKATADQRDRLREKQ